MIEMLTKTLLERLQYALNPKIDRTLSVLDTNFLENALESPAFEARLSHLIRQMSYGVEDVFTLMKPFMERLAGDEWPDHMLSLCYDYSVNLSFPEHSTVKLSEKLEAVARIYLTTLRILSKAQKDSKDGTWQSRYAIRFLTEQEIQGLEDSTEYLKFIRCFEQDYVYEMMKLNQSITGYTTLDHVCGVHHLALNVGRQLKYARVPVDLGRVSGAAAGHDVGKYGCRGDEIKRVAYYHYYYTGKWFENRDITYIRNVAINHSTWDLEVENLSLESLVLIYSDFRVKSDDNGRMRFYTLSEAFRVILEKLDNVDEAKELRYKRVYDKLLDFEDYMHHLGVNTDPEVEVDMTQPYKRPRVHYSLTHGNDLVTHAKFLSIEHNILLMHRLRNETTLNRMLESARGLENANDLRGYIDILEDYNTYLTIKQKQIVVNFLYSKLTSSEEDVRKQCAVLMGVLIANMDENLRKELPASAAVELKEEESLEMLRRYLRRMLEPEQKIIGKHRGWIAYSLQNMIRSYFNAQNDPDKRARSIEILFETYRQFSEDSEKRIFMLNSFRALPTVGMNASCSDLMSDFIVEALRSEDLRLRMNAMNVLSDLFQNPDSVPGREKLITDLKNMKEDDMHIAERYARARILESVGLDNRLRFINHIFSEGGGEISDVFLSNLKTATHDIIKKFQIHLLLDYATQIKHSEAFYTAMHFSNLLKVSAFESVRNTAGAGLIRLVDDLTFEQRNDIVIELLRALEMESYQFTRYIPEYLGKIIISVKPKELDEILDDFKDKMKRSNAQLGMLIAKTVGVMIRNYSMYRIVYGESETVYRERLYTMLGILLNGLVSFIPTVTESAMSVIGKDIFGDVSMLSEDKLVLFKMAVKKILTLLNNTDDTNELIFLNNASGLKHIYHFISDYKHQQGPIEIPVRDRIAFFPGSFDPFSLSHKQIARDIRNLGFEVYLAVDEFSWSKRTQPNLIRRDIIKMSVADELEIYTFPRDYSINIANVEDLEFLKSCFDPSEVYIVVGSDVVLNASAYGSSAMKKGIMNFAHIVFDRRFENSDIKNDALMVRMSALPEHSILLSLPPQYELISSTQIRNYIDDNRDISELVDPLAHRYIYEKGLYQREPQFKEVMTTKSLDVRIITNPSLELLAELAAFIGGDQKEAFDRLQKAMSLNDFRILIVRGLVRDTPIVGFSCFHWLRSANIYKEFSGENLMNTIREQCLGRIIVIDGIYTAENRIHKNPKQMLLTETLAFCLSRDYTNALYRDVVHGNVDSELCEILELQGFRPLESEDPQEHLYAVDMSSPCTLNLDIKSLIKDPYKNSERITAAIVQSRKRLQRAMTALYPGHLVLSFDRSMIYESLIKKICDENGVPTTQLEPRQNGEFMCVPFGDILKRWIMPNTVTKAIHVEKYFSPSLETYRIEAYPYYLDLDNQTKMLKSFNRPVMMVDDILDKGYRIKEIEPVMKRFNVEIRKIFVGVLSGRGKALMESKHIEVDTAYFIPRLRVWFNEGKMYPFIGGDAVWKSDAPERNMIPSINLILPYASPSFIKGASVASIYRLSETAIENSIEIMTAIEEEYQRENDRVLTFSRLGEVFVYPRFPDKGDDIRYDVNRKVTEYLKLDLATLKKLKNMLVVDKS
jgi:nicotinic acid mononucleotide adenylyltransferase